jgi:hypothetical protein
VSYSYTHDIIINQQQQQQQQKQQKQQPNTKEGQREKDAASV